jgi:hypothetical protein
MRAKNVVQQQPLPGRELSAGRSREQKIAARRLFSVLLRSKHWNRGICPFHHYAVADFARRGPGVMRGTFRYLIGRSAMGTGEILTTVAFDLHHTITPCECPPIQLRSRPTWLSTKNYPFMKGRHRRSPSPRSARLTQTILQMRFPRVAAPVRVREAQSRRSTRV